MLTARDRAIDIATRAQRRPRRAHRQRDLPRRAGRGRGGSGGDHHRPAQLQRRQGARLTLVHRRGRGDVGLVATVIVLPALLLSFWLVLQYAAGGARPPRRPGRGPGRRHRRRRGIGRPVVRRRPADRWFGWLVDVGRTGRRRAAAADEITVTVSADVLQVFPIGEFDVTVSASAPIERFVPQPERP